MKEDIENEKDRDALKENMTLFIKKLIMKLNEGKVSEKVLKKYVQSYILKKVFNSSKTRTSDISPCLSRIFVEIFLAKVTIGLAMSINLYQVASISFIIYLKLTVSIGWRITTY